MTSIIKVQNIQYTDGDAALTIADGGGVTAASNLAVTGTSTLSNTLNVSHGTSGANVATFVNTSANGSSNGVVHVKQTGATNQPTMVLEQTGGGGNPSDTQGLHIKMAGQNQGTGKAIRITTENSSLNSGNAYDPFTVTNGGGLTIKNTSNITTLDLTTAGVLSAAKQPMCAGFRTGTRLNTSNGYAINTYHKVPFTEYLDTTNSYNTSTHQYTFPVAGKYLYSTKQLVYSSSGGYISFEFTYNSSKQAYIYQDMENRWESIGGSFLINAAANDTCHLDVYYTSAGAKVHEGAHGFFNIIKIA
tara:strand:- start:1158 stop:2066 length:909 start_codon:yes stop_codon:yes gene_type:complete